MVRTLLSKHLDFKMIEKEHIKGCYQREFTRHTNELIVKLKKVVSLVVDQCSLKFLSREMWEKKMINV
jgi:hypothetical protein